MDMAQCGIDWLDEFVERRGMVDYRLLAILTSECNLGNIAYIVSMI